MCRNRLVDWISENRSAFAEMITALRSRAVRLDPAAQGVVEIVVEAVLADAQPSPGVVVVAAVSVLVGRHVAGVVVRQRIRAEVRLLVLRVEGCAGWGHHSDRLTVSPFRSVSNRFASSGRSAL